MTAKRLDQGGLIDRSQTINFTWDGMPFQGYKGDSLASALMANNQQILSRSFKYHRPRGIMSSGVEESGAIVTVGEGAYRDPNVKATMQPLYDGLAAFGQNAWPSVRHDFGAINGLFGRFFSAGFYYKTFMGLPPFEHGEGTGLWMQYEKIIRKAAGMGEASREPDPDHYDHGHDFCDVLIVGGGPTGLAAARVLVEAGLDVVLAEQEPNLGGDLLNSGDQNSAIRRQQMIKVAQELGVRIKTNTTVFGLYDHGVAGMLERVTDHQAKPEAHQPRQIFWTIRAKHTIVATGALERTISFGNNDLPGVMTANAGRSYLNRYGVLPGHDIVISTNNDSAYMTAAELAKAGADVTLLDARGQVPSALSQIAGGAGVVIRNNTTALEAQGRNAVNGIELAVADGESWRLKGHESCDALLVSGGWSPVVNLVAHRGTAPVWNAENACFIAPILQEKITVAGAAAGVWQTEACVQAGLAAGSSVAERLGVGNTLLTAPEIGGWEAPIKPLYEVKVPNKKLKCFVDPQHDVTTDDVRLAHQEGFVSVEHLKRYTTLGMATDGGKMGNVIALALMAEALGKEIPEVGTTRFRPPYTPVALGALRGRNVGHHFRALRRTPMHDWNLAHGATMTEAGLWHRPWYFAREGETITEAYIREAKTVRETVGLCDVTSLGKIAIQGPDAATLLNRIYSNAFLKLPVGKARYGIMLRDDGIVMDDGTTWRFSEQDFFMTTTTANAGKVMVWLEELLQVRWPELKVNVTSVSEQWAGCAVAGPQAREVLQDSLENPDEVTNENLPFMGVLETTMKGGIPCRIARISFSGERAYEVYVPSDYAEAMMDLLWGSAEPRDGCLYGLEALGALRIEKGHVTGAELDGRVTIEDAGLGGMASKKKAFIGNVLRKRPELLKDDRAQLVGFFPKDRSKVFNAGAIVCAQDKVSGLGEGWVTAVTHSPALGHWIGLGYIKGGHQLWEGKTAVASDPVRIGDVEVEIVSPHMYDPSGERMRG